MMNKDEKKQERIYSILAFLDKNNINYKKDGSESSNWIVIDPHKKHGSLNSSLKLSLVSGFVIDFNSNDKKRFGDIELIGKKVLNLNDKESKKVADDWFKTKHSFNNNFHNYKVEKPKEFDKNQVKLSNSNDKAIDILKRRKIDSELIDYFIEKNAIAQDVKNNLVFLKRDPKSKEIIGGQKINSQFQKYNYAGSNNSFGTMFHYKNKKAKEKEIVFVESSIDALSFIQLKKNMSNNELIVISLDGVNNLKKVVSNNLKDLLNKEEFQNSKIVLGLDKDKVGIDATYNALKNIEPLNINGYRQRYVSVEMPKDNSKDFNDLVKKDAGNSKEIIHLSSDSFLKVYEKKINKEHKKIDKNIKKEFQKTL